MVDCILVVEDIEHIRNLGDTMESSNLQIYWHESQPVYSLCFQHSQNLLKLFTAGGDNKIRAWYLNTKKSDTNDHCSKIETIDFLSSLQQHEQAVNVVRFNNHGKGNILASAGDDGQILLWKQNDTIVKEFGMDEAEANSIKESWYVYKRLRFSSNSEIYDLCWSPDDKYIVVGCMDNCIRIFDVESEKCIVNLKEHNHYVQGVSWDPLNEFIFSQSADRSVQIYKIIFNEDKSLQGLKLQNKIIKTEMPLRNINTKQIDFDLTKTSYLLYNETLPSFFRRLTVSPCGSLLCIPAGIYKTENKTINESNESNKNSEYANAVYIYTRGSLSRENTSNRPIISIPFLKKPAIVVSFNSNFYKLSGTKSNFIDLQYRLVFAIATSNEVLIYDTEHKEAISIIGNMHYTPLTDLSWSEDGTLLMISSTDGFCSYISIDPHILGEKLDEKTKLQFLKKDDDVKIETPKLEIKSNESITVTETPPPVQLNKKQNDIISILPVKRKIPPTNVVESTNENIESTTGEQSTKSPERAKKRIQPTLLKISSDEK